MQTAQQFSIITLALFTGVLLTGCGGGSGGGAAATAPAGPVTSTLSFPILQAYKSFIAAGTTKSFVVSGSCTGTASATSAPATTAAVFETNLAALSAANTITFTLANAPGITGCNTIPATTYTRYVDSNYTPLGTNSPGVNYGVYLIAPIIPASGVIGGANGTGVIGTETLYTDSTKAVGAGRLDVSYVLEADTANTAIVNLIAKNYTTAGVLSSTEQDRYRISATGALVPLSMDVVYYSTGINLLFN
jgi:hypothetical protein